MENLNVILHLSEDNWKSLEDTNVTFEARFVKMIVEHLKNYDNIVNFVMGGYLQGYTIECPACKVNYDISLQELNEDVIVCQDCGKEYLQRRHIVDLICGDI